MKIYIATDELVVLETEDGELTDENAAQLMVRSALEMGGLAQWDSIEIENFTYRDQGLLFAKPVRLYFPSFLTRLLD